MKYKLIFIRPNDKNKRLVDIFYKKLDQQKEFKCIRPKDYYYPNISSRVIKKELREKLVDVDIILIMCNGNQSKNLNIYIDISFKYWKKNKSILDLFICSVEKNENIKINIPEAMLICNRTETNEFSNQCYQKLLNEVNNAI